MSDADRSITVRRVLAVAATAIATAGIVAVVMLGRGHHPQPFASRATQVSNPSEPNGNSPRAVTVRTVDRLLAAAPVLPGSKRRAGAPAPDIRNGVSRPSSPNFVQRVTWFVAPGSMSDALAYFGAHVANKFGWFGGDTYTDHGVTKVRSATYAPLGRAWLRADVYTALELSIAVTPLGDGVGVAVYADAIWLAPRPDNIEVPLTVTSVRVEVDRGVFANSHGAPIVRKTLGRHDARHLARLVNSLPSNQRGVFSCPEFLGKDTLAFSDAAKTTVVIDVGACGGAEISKLGVKIASVGFASTRSPAVNAAVMRAMGLPIDYGG